MLSLSNNDIKKNTDLFVEAYKNSKGSAFTEKDFLKKVIPRISQKVNRKYPYQVRLPKSTQEMLHGDFEPSRVITIEKPIEGPYGEMWFGDATLGMSILCGYKNGDSRYMCDVALGDADIHGILVGATGQGKSVTQNAIIYGANYIYAPWEVNMILCDAKIVEFKSIALNNPMPQIIAVGATQDADYLISVLDDQKKAMLDRNSIFVEAEKKFGKSVKKIAEFREVTGLSIPQVIIDIDEFQAMFAGAKKKASILTDILQQFAKLGRNTGFHLLMASQEIGSDIPKTTLANMKVRMAMGCSKDVSTAILGNPKGYDNYGKQGYMYLNTGGGGDEKGVNNVLYRVPYPAPPQIKEMSHAIIEKGKELDVTPVMSFYDEEAMVYTSEFSDYIKKFQHGKDRILLGEPSFVLHDKDQCVKLLLTGEDIENILIDAPTDYALARYVIMLKKNIEMCQGVSNVVNCIRNEVDRISRISELAGKLFFEDKQYDGSDFYAIARTTVYKRRMILDADKALSSGIKMANETTNKLFEEHLNGREGISTVTFKERFAHYLSQMCSDATVQTGLGLASANSAGNLKINSTMIDLAFNCIQMCKQWGCSEKLVTYKDMPPVYFWDVGIDRIVGLGRSSKSKFVQEYLKVLQDCSAVSCRFIIVTTSMEDINTLLGGIRWYLMETPTTQELGRLKVSESYPDMVPNKLAVLFDRNDAITPCKKFKKMLHDGEIPG